jgi:hypothetical protein
VRVVWRDAHGTAILGFEGFLETGSAKGFGKALNAGRADSEGTGCIDESEAEKHG